MAVSYVESSKVNKDISALIREAMQAKDISISDLSIAVGTTYEYMRVIVKGNRIPATPTLRSICNYLGIDCAEAERMVKAQKIKTQYGVGSFLETLPKELQFILESWNILHENQQKFIFNQVRKWVGEQG